MKDLCQKCNIKLIFRGVWNSLMVWPDWPWPHILRRMYATETRHCIAMFSNGFSHRLLIISPRHTDNLFNIKATTFTSSQSSRSAMSPTDHRITTPLLPGRNTLVNYGRTTCPIVHSSRQRWWPVTSLTWWSRSGISLVALADVQLTINRSIER